MKIAKQGVFDPELQANQGLREVVKEYRCLHDKTDCFYLSMRCPTCIKADTLLMHKFNMKKENTMKYEAVQDKNNANEWRVEAIDFDGDGDCYVTIFGVPSSESRAREYAAWKQG